MINAANAAAKKSAKKVAANADAKKVAANAAAKKVANVAAKKVAANVAANIQILVLEAARISSNLTDTPESGSHGNGERELKLKQIAEKQKNLRAQLKVLKDSMLQY